MIDEEQTNYSQFNRSSCKSIYRSLYNFQLNKVILFNEGTNLIISQSRDLLMNTPGYCPSLARVQIKRICIHQYSSLLRIAMHANLVICLTSKLSLEIQNSLDWTVPASIHSYLLTYLQVSRIYLHASKKYETSDQIVTATNAFTFLAEVFLFHGQEPNRLSKKPQSPLQ